MPMTTEQVWETFATPLRQFIRRRVRDEDSAEDILQEVFLKIHARGATLRADEKLGGWLYQVARNAVVDHHRRRLRDRDRETPLPDDAEQRFAMPDAAGEARAEARLRALAPCVRALAEALPGRYREALLLTELEGLTQKDLAERLGLSFSGAKTRVQRAREKLRALLLACCHLEFDRAGRVVDYHPGCSRCAVDSCGPAAAGRREDAGHEPPGTYEAAGGCDVACGDAPHDPAAPRAADDLASFSHRPRQQG